METEELHTLCQNKYTNGSNQTQHGMDNLAHSIQTYENISQFKKMCNEFSENEMKKNKNKKTSNCSKETEERAENETKCNVGEIMDGNIQDSGESKDIGENGVKCVTDTENVNRNSKISNCLENNKDDGKTRKELIHKNVVETLKNHNDPVPDEQLSDSDMSEIGNNTDCVSLYQTEEAITSDCVKETENKTKETSVFKQDTNQETNPDEDKKDFVIEKEENIGSENKENKENKVIGSTNSTNENCEASSLEIKDCEKISEKIISINIDEEKISTESELEMEGVHNKDVKSEKDIDSLMENKALEKSEDVHLDSKEESGNLINSADVCDQKEKTTADSQQMVKIDILSTMLDMTGKSQTEHSKIDINFPSNVEIKEEKKLRNIHPIIHSYHTAERGKKPKQSPRLEIKSVTFSQDTIFNENKSKQYRKERVSLNNVYRGRISSPEAYAKINPIFEDDSDDDNLYKTRSSSTGQALGERRNSLVYLGDDSCPSRNNRNDPSLEFAVLNFPAYMQKYLQNDATFSFVTTKTGKSSASTELASESGEFSSDQSNKGKVTTNSEDADSQSQTLSKSDRNEVFVSVGAEVAGYDVLIKKTLARQKNHLIMKWVFAILFLLTIVTIVAIVVYYEIIKR